LRKTVQYYEAKFTVRKHILFLNRYISSFNLAHEYHFCGVIWSYILNKRCNTCREAINLQNRGAIGMNHDLAHKRPWLLFSLLFGISYPIAAVLDVPGIWAIIWKVAGLALLVPYALRRHHSGEFAILAGVLAFCALGDGLVEIQLELGAAAFGVAHILAIWLYLRHRRVKPVLSQTLLAAALLILTPFIAYFLGGVMACVYAVLLGAMAACAWSSNFPRYRVGIGAVLFVISDLILLAREGGSIDQSIFATLSVWYTYYCGMFLIATGVVQTLIKRGHFKDAEGL
jgi:uncharacterized membrane protein YhhN